MNDLLCILCHPEWYFSSVSSISPQFFSDHLPLISHLTLLIYFPSLHALSVVYSLLNKTLFVEAKSTTRGTH